MAGERILVVDDNAYDLESMEKLLREEGYEVVSAPTRPAALGLCETVRHRGGRLARSPHG